MIAAQIVPNELINLLIIGVVRFKEFLVGQKLFVDGRDAYRDVGM